jgi:RNA-directed DNA polymerase
MAQQNNEDSAVLQGLRKLAVTDSTDCRGGKGVPVNQQSRQLGLPFGTAENPVRTEAAVRVESTPLASSNKAAPKPSVKTGSTTTATMEQVVRNLPEAFRKVASNRGAPGPDRRSIKEVKLHLRETMQQLTAALRNGSYTPGDIRRVWLPKSGGGRRGLGIPNVVDRWVQEAIRMVLEPLYEPGFHPSSHGFRPKRSCHTAIEQAQKHVEDGCDWVVDIDLSKFFDRVCHQRLRAKLEQRVRDPQLIILIVRLMKANVVLPDGVVVSTKEGVPQGSPLSPLLSNVVLDELDRELGQRGHRFVRYADDCNIYMNSERAATRVMESVTRFIEGRLRLEVNRDKSAVARIGERHFVGFTLRRDANGKVGVELSKRSRKRIDTRIRELTPRNWGGSLETCIRQVSIYLRGWFGFFKVCTTEAERTFGGFDAHIRRRLRAIVLKHWKRKRTIVHKLIKLGVKPKTAWRRVYAGRKSIWVLSHDYVAERGLRNVYFAERGLVSLRALWLERAKLMAAPAQQELALG